MTDMAVVILAAGASRRFGAIKQLTQINGEPMLQRVIDRCQQLENTDLYIVLGANNDEIQSALSLRQQGVIFNADWSEGIGSSIRIATQLLQENYQAILFMAGDQPLIEPDQLQVLIAKWRQSCECICAASYQGTVGIPAIFPSEFFPQLVELAGDMGAKKVIVENPKEVQLVDIAEAAIDIDRPEDARFYQP